MSISPFSRKYLNCGWQINLQLINKVIIFPMQVQKENVKSDKITSVVPSLSRQSFV